MGILMVRCPVLGAEVARVVDLENRTVQIICGEYEEVTGVCRRKQAALGGGPLGQLLAHLDEAPADTSTIHCDLRDA